MAGDRGNRASARRGFVGARLLALLTIGIGFNGAAWAGSFDLPFGTEADYKLTFSYALAARTKHASQDLINGPVDPFESSFMPTDNGEPSCSQSPTGCQLLGFTHTGLPNTANFDDGDRNFQHKWNIINNRVSAFGELGFKNGNYGLSFTGSAFYDQAYHGYNSNDSLPYDTDGSTVNKTGAPNGFTNRTRHYDGLRARLLDAYAYADWTFGEDMNLDLRVGQQLVAWGESLFFSGVALAQGPADAAKAFVPGAEIKDILLPVSQVALRFSPFDKLTILGQYKLDFKSTELFPEGDYFSPADLIGPGATFGYGSVNPAYGTRCPGLLQFPGLPDLSFLCSTVPGHPTGTVLNASPYIYITRGPDIEPSKHGQWGVGVTYQITSATNIGLYRLRYADTNPAIQLNTGYAVVGHAVINNQATTITTQAFNQVVPTTYNIKYYGGITMSALSFSTAVGKFNIAGELGYRQDMDTQVQAHISGVLSPVYTRANLEQALLSTLYVDNPGFVLDDLAVVAEAGVIRITHTEALQSAPGISMVGNGGVLFADRTSSAFQMLAIGGNHNVISGWDLKNQLSFATIIKGNPANGGAFGSLIGQGDRRLGWTVTMTYLANMEFSLGYNMFFGNPAKRQHDVSPVEQNPFSDRDYVSFNVKYNL